MVIIYLPIYQTISEGFSLITESGSNNSRGGSPVKDALPHSPSSSNQTNSHGARLGNKNSSSVASSQNKLLSSPHHRETSNNLAKSDLNIVSTIIFYSIIYFDLHFQNLIYQNVIVNNRIKFSVAICGKQSQFKINGTLRSKDAYLAYK